MKTYSYNSLLQFSNKTETWTERILWIDEQNDQVVVFRIELDAKKQNQWAWPFWRTMDELKDGRLLAKDRFLRPAANLNKLTAKDHKDWQTVQTALGHIINDPKRNIFRGRKHRRGMISKAAKIAGVNRRTIYDWLTKYWKGGQTPQCLLPDRRACGGQSRKSNGGKKRGRPDAAEVKAGHKIAPALNEDIKKLLLQGRDKFYNKGVTSLELAYKLTLGEFFNDGHEQKDGVWVPVQKPKSEMPKFRTFAYVHSLHRDPVKEAEEREGEKNQQLTGRALLGNTETSLLGPGQVGQMDATTADIYLVSDDDRSVIVGRPTVYGIKDAWGRFMYSIVTTFERPSYWAGALALETALRNKVEYCAGYGITIGEDDWPVDFLPAKILVDRGEMSTYKSDHIVRALGLDIDSAPPNRGDLKAVIERHFGLINEQMVKWLPGALPRFVKDRHKRNELDAILTINEFRFLLLEATLKYHDHLMKDYKLDEDMIAAGIGRRPIQLLKWARVHRGGGFRRVDLDFARLHLLPGDKASVTSKGIYFKGIYFSCERAVTEKWFERARRYGHFKVEIAFDPRRVEPIYLRNGNTTAIEPCHLTSGDARFRGWTWEALEEYRKNRRAEEIESAPQEAQNAVELHATREQIAANARARQMEVMAANGGQSNASRLNKIPKNRAEAKAKERADSLQNGTTPESPSPTTDDEPARGKIIPLPEATTKPKPAQPAVQSKFLKNLEAKFGKAKGKL